MSRRRLNLLGVSGERTVPRDDKALAGSGKVAHGSMNGWACLTIQASSMDQYESRPSTIGHITLDTKQTGAPSAGNPHAGCDVAGAGNGFTVGLLRHSRGNGEQQLGLTYGIPRQSSTRPARDQ